MIDSMKVLQRGRRLVAHLGIHGRRPWRRLSGVVLSPIGRAGLSWSSRPKSGVIT
jgi:hypothetical protein